MRVNNTYLCVRFCQISATLELEARVLSHFDGNYFVVVVVVVRVRVRNIGRRCLI